MAGSGRNIFTWKILSFLTLLCHFNDVYARYASAKIVVMPLPVVSSQYFNMLEIAEEMQRRGNEVSILTSQVLKKRESPVKHIDYVLHDKEGVRNDIKNLAALTHSFNPALYLSILRKLMQLLSDTCQDILESNDTRNAIAQADMIIALSTFACGTYVADIYDKPFVVVHVLPLPAIGSYAQVPMPPSYVPAATATLTEEMTFIQRTKNFLLQVAKDIGVNAVVSYYFRNLQEKYNRKSSDSFSQLFGKAEAYIVIVDFAYEFVHPIMPNVFVVGPFTTKPAKELSDELEDFMQSSGEHGVVVISFGTVLESLNEGIVKNIMAAVSRLKQKVIWKAKVAEKATIPANLKVVEWLPQNDLLGHEKTRAFVSHMGINGATEAAYHGVPIVAASVYSDNFANALKFEKKAKMAKFIDVFNANADTWHETIVEVIYNTSYKVNAMKTSKLLSSWPRTNVEKAGDVIQYAIDNGGRLPHLKSYAGNLYWFQYHCIDVILFLLAILCLAVFAFCKITKVLIACICSAKKKDKSD